MTISKIFSIDDLENVPEVLILYKIHTKMNKINYKN